MGIYNRYYYAEGTPDVPRSPTGLVAAGPVLAVQVELPPALAKKLQDTNAPIPPPVNGFALIDTGAMVSSIDISVVNQLNLQPIDVAEVRGATGRAQQATYAARFTFPGTSIPAIDYALLTGAPVSDAQHAQGPEPLIAIIGRDLLQYFLLIYNGPQGTFTIAL